LPTSAFWLRHRPEPELLARAGAVRGGRRAMSSKAAASNTTGHEASVSVRSSRRLAVDASSSLASPSDEAATGVRGSRSGSRRLAVDASKMPQDDGQGDDEATVGIRGSKRLAVDASKSLQGDDAELIEMAQRYQGMLRDHTRQSAGRAQDSVQKSPSLNSRDRVQDLFDEDLPEDLAELVATMRSMKSLKPAHPSGSASGSGPVGGGADDETDLEEILAAIKSTKTLHQDLGSSSGGGTSVAGRLKIPTRATMGPSASSVNTVKETEAALAFLEAKAGPEEMAKVMSGAAGAHKSTSGSLTDTDAALAFLEQAGFGDAFASQPPPPSQPNTAVPRGAFPAFDRSTTKLLDPVAEGAPLEVMPQARKSQQQSLTTPETIDKLQARQDAEKARQGLESLWTGKAGHEQRGAIEAGAAALKAGQANRMAHFGEDEVDESGGGESAMNRARSELTQALDFVESVGEDYSPERSKGLQMGKTNTLKFESALRSLESEVADDAEVPSTPDVPPAPRRDTWATPPNVAVSAAAPTSPRRDTWASPPEFKPPSPPPLQSVHQGADQSATVSPALSPKGHRRSTINPKTGTKMLLQNAPARPGTQSSPRESLHQTSPRPSAGGMVDPLDMSSGRSKQPLQPWTEADADMSRSRQPSRLSSNGSAASLRRSSFEAQRGPNARGSAAHSNSPTRQRRNSAAEPLRRSDTSSAPVPQAREGRRLSLAGASTALGVGPGEAAAAAAAAHAATGGQVSQSSTSSPPARRTSITSGRPWSAAENQATRQASDTGKATQPVRSTQRSSTHGASSVTVQSPPTRSRDATSLGAAGDQA
ncbi:unnamed protein product, partial [Prorocentrum cordatum]